MSTVTSPSRFGPPTATSTTHAGLTPAVAEGTFRTLRLLFRTSLYFLVCLASVMLAWAEGTWNPVLFTIPLAAVAFVVTGARGGIFLPNALANVAGAIALFACYSEFAGGDQEARLLSGAHLLVYLMWIVLYQKKTEGTFWWIIALTVLQVAVGALLLQSADYGLSLVLYGLAVIWTLSVFSVYRAYDAARGGNGEGDRLDENPIEAPSSVAGYGVLRAASQTAPTVHLDERPGVLGLRFIAGVLGTTIGAFAVSFLVFLLFPRIWIGQHQFIRGVEGEEGNPTTGFSESMRLGEVGTILESTERVFEVRMSDVDTGQAVDVEQYALALGEPEPMFRGKVLEMYWNGEWAPLPWEAAPIPTNVTGQPGMIRQDYRLDETGSKVLFAMQPIRTVYARDDQGFVPTSRGIFNSEFNRRGRRRTGTVEYTAFSWPRRGPGAISDLDLRPMSRLFQLRRLLQSSQLPRIAAFVEDERNTLQSGRRTPQQVADDLLKRLRDSGDYGYSLTDSRPPERTDPVVHFLLERRTGHCEYFASALVLMLRECGIPARVIIGFKGGTTNRFTGYFEVEQRHAHAWVEAYITDEPLVVGNRQRMLMQNTEENVTGGRWVVLDPTPAAARSESVESNARSVQSWSDLKNYLADQWTWYVVKMNEYKQADQFYVPIRDFCVDLWNAVTGDAESRRAFRQRLWEIWNSPASWFSPVGFVVTFVLLSVVYVVTRFVWWLVRWLLGRTGDGVDRVVRADSIRVPFYERFLVACQRLGLERSTTETPREFAANVRRHLDGRLGDGSPEVDAASVCGLPDDVVRDFYAVRFGGTSLPQERIVELNDELGRFEATVASVMGRR